jgi:hypothetical protein
MQNHSVKNVFGPDLYFSQFSFFHMENLSVSEFEWYYFTIRPVFPQGRNLVLPVPLRVFVSAPVPLFSFWARPCAPSLARRAKL